MEEIKRILESEKTSLKEDEEIFFAINESSVDKNEYFAELEIGWKGYHDEKGYFMTGISIEKLEKLALSINQLLVDLTRYDIKKRTDNDKLNITKHFITPNN